MQQQPVWTTKSPSPAPPKWFKASGFGMHVTTFVPSEKRVDIQSGERDTILAVQWTEEITGEPIGWRVYCRRKDPTTGHSSQHIVVDLSTPELELAFGLKDEPGVQNGESRRAVVAIYLPERCLFKEGLGDKSCVLDAFRRGHFARLGRFLVLEDLRYEKLIPVFVGDTLRDCVEELIRTT